MTDTRSRTVKRLYIKVTRDKYELPIAVAESAGELAKYCGVTKNSILKSITRGKDPNVWTSYRKILIDE